MVGSAVLRALKALGLDDALKAKALLGWEPSTTCPQLAELMVDDDLDLARHHATHQSLKNE